MRTKIQKWGNSMGIRIPANILKDLNLKEGDPLGIDIYNNKIVLNKIEDLKIEEVIADYEANSYPYSEYFDPDDVRGKELW